MQTGNDSAYRTKNQELFELRTIKIVQFETEDEFNHWYKHEPYIVSGVWKTIEVKPFRVANV